MSEVTSLNAERADRENDNRLYSPSECLESLAAELRQGKPCSSLLVLRLDTGPDGREYNTGFSACNLSGSEMLALIEATKPLILQNMGLIPE